MSSSEVADTSKRPHRRRSTDGGPDVESLQRQLEQARAHFRDVIERNADAHVVIDREGIICFANPVATRLFGAPLEDIVGSPFGFPITAGETTEVDIAPGGEPRVAEMRAMSTEWEGAPAFIASLRDVTDRKRAEHNARRLIQERGARVAAEEAARRVQFLLDTTMTLSASLDYERTLSRLGQLCVEHISDWTVVYGVGADGVPKRLDVAHRDPERDACARELRGIPIDAQGAHPVLEVLRTREPRIVADVTDEMLARMASDPRELELARTLGVSSYMLVPIVARDRALGAIAFVRSEPGRAFTGVDVALAQDIATRAALAMDNALLYREAQRANQQKADFLAVVSHDLRTPLTAIIGYSDLLLMGIPEPVSENVNDRVSRVRTSANHLLYLLNELLAFARLESGHEQLDLKDTDLRAVVREVADVAEPLAAARQLDLRVVMPDAAVHVVTDADKVRQILLNLVGNAVKYTHKGHVSIELSECDRRCAISVSDTGEGIAEEHLPRIFDPFWQVDGTRRSRGGGTGLGLSVVKHLAGLLKGEITVRSTLGVGSTFTLTFPVQ